MNPEEKAKELIERCYTLIPRIGDFKKNWELAKQCALIAVEEIRNSRPTKLVGHLNGKDIVEKTENYWQQVKTEIEKL